MPRIHQLSTSIINKIAAGEVIERPASVVKELLENCLDALATRIDVDIVNGGSELIRIVDDGEGIHPDDLELAVRPHATSKIRSAEDLFGVQTMGFRGEALASVAEVSRLRIRSRQADQIVGRELAVNLGEISPVRECGCPQGTQIEVRNLFENTPVRRKFLKTVSTEFSHISEQFTRIALANPRLHLVLRHNDKQVMELPASPNLLDRLQLLFGSELADDLIPVESELGGVRMWGYVGHPDLSKSTRKMQHLFLNGRWITDRSLQHALTEGYRGLLMVGRQPIAFLFVELAADRADVNVHPTKIEVRFQDGQQLFRQLLSMIRSKFLSLDLQSPLRIPTPAAAGAPNRLQAKLAPVGTRQELSQELDDWTSRTLGTRSEAVGTVPELFTTSSRNMSAPSIDPWQIGRAAEVPEAVAEAATAVCDPPSTLDDVASVVEADAVVDELRQMPSPPPAHSQPAPSDTLSPTVPAVHQPAPVARPAPATDVVAPRAMQVHDCYLIVETAEGVTVIDQHALHERIMYEHLRSRVLAGAVESQRLLVPQPVELTPKEAAILLEQGDSLERAGLGVEDFGNGTLIVTRYPAMLRKVELQELIRDLVEKLEQGGSTAVQSSARRDILDEVLHMMSCKAAVKAGQRLTPEEIESLLAQRHLVDDAHHCPHGRPTALSLSRAELDRQFGRLG